MKTVVCLGNYAKRPYKFEKLDINVYCMEELCFCLKDNAFLLGSEIMTGKIIEFIGVDCGVSSLARELYSFINQKCTLSSFVTSILEYTGIYEQKIIEDIENTLKLGSGLNDFEKQKLRIDYS